MLIEKIVAMRAEKKWLFMLLFTSFLSLLFLASLSGFTPSYYTFTTSSNPFPSIVRHGPHYPPAFAYYISGSLGNKDRILRLLLAVYHPRNHYLLHLEADAGNKERMGLARAVRSVPAIRAFGNVEVVGKLDRITNMGSSKVADALRAAAILLKVDTGWD